MDVKIWKKWITVLWKFLGVLNHAQEKLVKFVTHLDPVQVTGMFLSYLSFFNNLLAVSVQYCMEETLGSCIGSAKVMGLMFSMIALMFVLFPWMAGAVVAFLGLPALFAPFFTFFMGITFQTLAKIFKNLCPLIASGEFGFTLILDHIYGIFNMMANAAGHAQQALLNTYSKSYPEVVASLFQRIPTLTVDGFFKTIQSYVSGVLQFVRSRVQQIGKFFESIVKEWTVEGGFQGFIQRLNEKAAVIGSTFAQTQDPLNCLAYMMAVGCEWTFEYNCHSRQCNEQVPGSEGRARNDNTNGYYCCCQQCNWRLAEPGREAWKQRKLTEAHEAERREDNHDFDADIHVDDGGGDVDIDVDFHVD
eukprot:TRINITY_DN33187_c0_g1_i1.p1 TRINITY_DN33187_c0_g1~~TRINITY_DN33187_c0_g1_i1.p1  ORF type:complete len:361 (+),score=38.30 TRINITY_DN33187_c0_g1_i1:315-1397(+)